MGITVYVEEQGGDRRWRGLQVVEVISWEGVDVHGICHMLLGRGLLGRWDRRMLSCVLQCREVRAGGGRVWCLSGVTGVAAGRRCLS